MFYVAFSFVSLNRKISWSFCASQVLGQSYVCRKEKGPLDIDILLCCTYLDPLTGLKQQNKLDNKSCPKITRKYATAFACFQKNSFNYNFILTLNPFALKHQLLGSRQHFHPFLIVQTYKVEYSRVQEIPRLTPQPKVRLLCSSCKYKTKLKMPQSSKK